MPIVVLLLVAILIVLIGGPIALGYVAGAAIVLPAWLAWSSGIFGVLFWGVVIVGALALVGGIGYLVLAAISPKTPMHTCVGCGHRQPADMRFCFKCSREHSAAS